MKRLKKLIVALTVATMVFGMVSSAFAAVNVGGTAFADVDADDDAATAFSVLAALGVYQGNEGIGGNVRPDSTITREEFAAVVVRFLDRDSTAQSLNTYVPSFTDANSISSWAWGYVNVANSLGIINGYPNGEFRPKNPVTHAEVLAMLTRAVNVDKAATGTWPLNYVVLGSSVGIDDDVDIVANVPATRGEVAIMTYNAYSVDQEWDSDDEKLVDREDDGGDTFGTDETENQVNGTVDSVSNTEIEIDGDSYDWAENAWVQGVDNLNDLVDLEVNAYINDDDEVVAVVVDDDDVTITTGEIDDGEAEDNSRLYVDDKRFKDIDADIVLYVNNAEVASGTAIDTEAELADYIFDNVEPNGGADLGDFNVDVTASVTVNDDGDVISVRILAWNYDGVEVDDYDDEEETIEVAGDTVNITDDTIITINGEAATFAEFQDAVDEFEDEYDEDAFVYVATEEGDNDGDVDAYRIALYTETVTGDVVGGGKDGGDNYVTLEIDGDEEDYELNTDYGLIANDEDEASELSGQTTLLLDMNGDAANVLESTSAVDDFYAIFERYRIDDDDEVTSVTVTNAAGDAVTYDVSDDDVASAFGLDTADGGYEDVIWVELDGNDIDSVAAVVYSAGVGYQITTLGDAEHAGHAHGNVPDGEADANDVLEEEDIEDITSSYVKVTNAGILPFADGGVLVFDATDDDDQIDVDDLKDDWTIVYAIDSEGAVGLIIVTAKP